MQLAMLCLATLLAGFCLNYVHDKVIKVSVCLYLLDFPQSLHWYVLIISIASVTERDLMLAT